MRAIGPVETVRAYDVFHAWRCARSRALLRSRILRSSGRSVVGMLRVQSAVVFDFVPISFPVVSADGQVRDQMMKIGFVQNDDAGMR